MMVSRVISLESAPRACIVGNGGSSLGLEKAILSGRLVYHIGKPSVPAWVDLGAIGGS